MVSSKFSSFFTSWAEEEDIVDVFLLTKSGERCSLSALFIYTYRLAILFGINDNTS